jgi:hypothetical protein
MIVSYAAGFVSCLALLAAGIAYCYWWATSEIEDDPFWWV